MHIIHHKHGSVKEKSNLYKKEFKSLLIFCNSLLFFSFYIWMTVNFFSNRCVYVCILQESERKAYNPRSFCKVYTMDHQPLNTAEQKDMAEFFIDLVSKLEEMTPTLKTVVKNLFCGVISNNVVSLVRQITGKRINY